MKRRWEAAIAGLQRIQLALTGDFDYLTFDKYELDVDNVVALLEEANDELKPRLEELARRQGA